MDCNLAFRACGGCLDRGGREEVGDEEVEKVG